MTQETHPTQEQLAAFSAGKLGLAESTEIETHLEDCDSCCEVLKSLPADTMDVLFREFESDTAVAKAAAEKRPGEATQLPASEQATVPPRESGTRASAGQPSMGVGDLPQELVDHPRYRVIELLGAGGMGDVYLAEHRVMNRPVALKVIRHAFVERTGAVERFTREIEAAAKLTHPNIVTAHDAEQAGNLHLLVMEYVDGIDLDQLLKQRGPLPVEEACDYIRQAAIGLQCAHESGMVHRDIKPHNLMVTGGRDQGSGARGQGSGFRSREVGRQADAVDSSTTPVVKILDFGLANFVSESATSSGLTEVGSIMGTPDYMSPEQARDASSADIRADIYSLGCTLYCLLTGQAPYPEGTVIEKVMAHTEKEPKPMSEFRDDVPPELIEVLAKMMAKDANERYQTPKEAAEALSAFLTDNATVQTTKPSPRVAPRGPRMVKTVIALSAALTILFGAAIIIATDRGRIEIQSEFDDIQIVVTQNGQQITTIDLKTGSQVSWLPTGDYKIELKSKSNDVKLSKTGFEMTRLGKVIVTVTYATDVAAFQSFNPKDQPITEDRVTPEDGGWKITANKTRTVRLFEVTPPNLLPGPFFYRAKLKTKDVKGRAYLEMWVRFPGKGEFFSKGFHNAVSGSNGWAEYEIPFFLQKGQQPDLVKLNLTIEGGGTVWIKDIELRGRFQQPDSEKSTPAVARPETQRALMDLVEAARGELSDEELKQVIADHCPLLRAYPQTMGREVIEMVTGLPDSSHQVLLEKGYLKWRFSSLDPERRDGMRKIAGGFLSGTIKHLPEARQNSITKDSIKRVQKILDTADVGFAVLAPTDASDQVIYWYAQPQNSPIPLMYPLTGVNKKTASKALSRSTYKQLAELEDKPYSDVPQPRLQSDTELIQGTWIAESGERSGRPTPKDQLGIQRVIFKDDTMQMVMPGGIKGEGFFTLEPAKNPKRIWMKVKGKNAGGRGIYRLEGDRLTVCIDLDSAKPMPTEFKTKEGTTLDVVVLKRASATTNANDADAESLPVKLTEVRRFEGHTRMINSVAVSPDGRFLLSAAHGGVLLLSNLETGKAEKTFAGHARGVYDVSFSRDGTAFSCSTDQTARRWDIPAGQEIRRYMGHTGSVSALAVSPDGKHLLTGSTWFAKDQQGIPEDNSLRLWDVETGKEVRRFEDVLFAIAGVAFASDGKSIVAGGVNSMLGLWDVETGKRIRRFTAPTNVMSVAFSPDGAQLASSHVGGFKDGKWFDPERSVIILWDVKTGREIRRLRGHTAKIQSLAFSPDGRFIASAAGGGNTTDGWHDAHENTVRIWDVATGEELARTELENSVQSVAFTPDGRQVVTGGGRSEAPKSADLRLWRLPEDVRSRVVGAAGVKLKEGQFLLREKNGRAMFTFAKWHLTFEGVACDSKGAGIMGIGSFNDPIPGAKGGGDSEFGGQVKIHQEFDSRANKITVNGYDFTLLGKATSLVFADRTYAAKATAQTIVIDKDGKTQLGPDAPSGSTGNLITDPSLENTSVGALSRSWSRYIDTDKTYQYGVVDGGRTGKKSLMLSGQGTRIHAFANGIPLDRSKRYVLRGWVRYEGDVDGSATIKFNYRKGGTNYHIVDGEHISVGRDGWQFLTKTDRADEVPEATMLWICCKLEGNGKAFFDDLELIAYDRDEVPTDFDDKHGKHNHSTERLDLDRWVGRWETTTEYKPTLTDARQSLKGEVIVRKIIDDRFLLWQWMSETGDLEYISILGFDKYAGGYHIWVFGSGGELNERIGQWNAASNTLKLLVKPPLPGVTGASTDRFVNDDRIESTLLVKGARGQITRDMRMTSIRKSKKVPDDIKLSKGPAAEPIELKRLQPMVGDWSIRSTMKPSVWEPDGKTSTFTEQIAWAIRGQFLVLRAYDEKKQLTSLSLMTFEEKQKSFHFWYFSSDTAGGQWRVNKDSFSNSKSFYWRSIDMPEGWIGTGFNRYVDDDTWDNSALIKDENGRVLLNSHQVKTRIKQATKIKAGRDAAAAWLKLVDAGKYAESWEATAQFNKSQNDKQTQIRTYNTLIKPLGKLLSRKELSAQFVTSMPAAPDGEYVVIKFKSSFENKKQAIETVVLMLEKDGKWRVSGLGLQ